TWARPGQRTGGLALRRRRFRPEKLARTAYGLCRCCGATPRQARQDCLATRSDLPRRVVSAGDASTHPARRRAERPAGCWDSPDVATDVTARLVRDVGIGRYFPVLQ